MSKLTRELVANAMLSSIENYVFEIVDSVQFDIGELTPDECNKLDVWVRSAVEKAAGAVEAVQ